MTKKTLEILYSQALADNDLLTTEINTVLKIKNDLYQDFTKQVLERDNLINGLRNTVLELTEEHEEERQAFNSYKENCLFLLVAQDKKIEELSKVIRGLHSDISTLKAQKDPEELTKEVWRLKNEIKDQNAEISELEARVEKYSDIHEESCGKKCMKPYYKCALLEQDKSHNEDLFNLTGR